MNKSTQFWPQRAFAVCISAVAVAGVISSTPGYSEPATPQVATRKTDTEHVYLLRGLFNVFSIGMDELRMKLYRRGIFATVHNHLEWERLANEAVRDYKSGRVGAIVIVGHSAGAIDAVDMANKIGSGGVPVNLLVTLDPAFRTTVTNSNVRWVVNLYMPNGIGAKVYKRSGYSGVIENIDLHNVPVHHMTLDKSDFVHDRVIKYTLRARKNGGSPSQAKAPAAAGPAKMVGLRRAAPP